MPLLLLLLPLGAIAYLLLARRGDAPGLTAWSGNPLVWDDAGVAAEQLEEPAPAELDIGFVQSIELGGGDLLQRIETGVDVVTAAARKAFSLPARGEQYREPIARAAEKYGIPESLLARLIQTESSFNPNALGPVTRSGERAVGIAQFMPATALELGVDPLDPIASINGAGRYLRQLYDALGDWPKAVAAYNWGIGNVQRKGLAAAPLETRNYLAKVLPA